VADINLGDVVARIRVDTSALVQGVQDANQRLQQLAQQLTQLQQAQQGTTQSLATVAQALNVVTQSTQQSTQQFAQFAQQQQATTQSLGASTQALQSLSTATSQSGTHAAQASEGWKSLGQVAAGLGLATGLQSLIRALVDFGQSVVTVGTQLQTLRASLASIAGGVTEGQRAFSQVTDIANRYGLSLTTLATAYRSLAAATRGTALEGRDTTALFTALAQASRVFGLTTEQTGRALLAFQQIISKGVVSQEELRQQLGEALPGVLQIAARAYGVTTAELNAMITKGVDMTDFVRKFTAQLQAEMPKGAQGVETAAQAFNHLGTEILLLKERIAESGLLKFLTDVAGQVATILQRLREVEEQQHRAGQTRTSQATGGRPVLPADTEKLLALTEQLTQAEDRLRGLQAARQQGAFGLLTPLIATEGQIAQAQKTVDTLRQQQTELAAVSRLRARAQTGITARLAFEGVDPLTEQQQRDRDAEAANVRLKGLLDQTSKSLKDLNENAKETPQVFGSLTGTAVQQVELLDRRIKILQTDLEKITDAIRTGPTTPAADLQQRKEALAAELTQAEARKKAIEDAVEAAEKAERKRAQQREAAISREISLTTELARLQTFIGQTEQSAPEQARATAEQQGLAARQTAAQALETIRQNPFINREFIPQFEAVLAAITEATRKKGEEAFTKADEQMRDHITKMGDQISQFQRQLSAAGLSPLEADLARIRDTFEQMRAKLLAFRTELGEERRRATEPRQAEIDAQIARLNLLEQGITPARDQELQERIDRPQTDELTRLRNRLAQLRAEPRERAGLRAEQRAADILTDPARQEEAARLIDQIKAQERLNYVIGLSEQLANSVGNAWTQALSSIAQGTATVGRAFQQMAQTILQSLAQIAAQEATKGLIRLVIGSLTGGGTGGALGGNISFGLGSGAASGIGGAIGGGSTFAEGGIVTRPTFALIGENAATTPEYVLNRQQMQGMMGRAIQAGASAGGQAVGGNNIAIINVANREQGEAEAARQRLLGRSVIINEVASELAQGDRSQLMKIIKLTSR
jgi:tape measure domain-containing protein